MDEVQDRLTSIGTLLGKAFGYGFLYCEQGRKDYIKYVISTALKKKSKVQGKRYRTCCTTSLINDSAFRDREAVDNDPKPIVANASEFSEHWSHWGKFLFSHLLLIYPLVTVGDNNNFILMLYLDCGGERRGE